MLNRAEVQLKCVILKQQNSGLEVGKGCQALSTFRTKSCNTIGGQRRVFIENCNEISGERKVCGKFLVNKMKYIKFCKIIIKNKEVRYKSKRQTLTTLLFRHFYRADLQCLRPLQLTTYHEVQANLGYNCLTINITSFPEALTVVKKCVRSSPV